MQHVLKMHTFPCCLNTFEPGYNDNLLYFISCKTSRYSVVLISSSLLTTKLHYSLRTTPVYNGTKHSVPPRMLQPSSTVYKMNFLGVLFFVRFYCLHLQGQEVPLSLDCLNLNMTILRCSETSVTTHCSKTSNIPEQLNLQYHCCKKLKSRKCQKSMKM
jgi:hypothetical protein